MTEFKVGDRVMNIRTHEWGTVAVREPGYAMDTVTVLYDGDDHQTWNTPVSKLVLADEQEDTQ